MRVVLIVLLACPLVLAAPVPRERKRPDDHHLILGKYQQVYPSPSSSVWVFLPEGKATIDHGGKADLVTAEFIIRPEKSPKELEWKLVPENIPFSGTYSLENGLLRFALKSGSEVPNRPQKLEARSTDAEVYHLSRMKD
jgi:hypothetical protein